MGGRIQDMGCAQAFSPLREGGAARWKDWQWDCAFEANGKGGGGSTAGGRRCIRTLGPSAKVLIRSLPVRSRACRDGHAQYSPRRGPCRFPFSRHGHPIHGRTPPLGGGANLGTLLGFLHSPNSGDGSTKVPEEPETWTISAGFPSPCNPRAGRPHPQDTHVFHPFPIRRPVGAAHLERVVPSCPGCRFFLPRSIHHGAVESRASQVGLQPQGLAGVRPLRSPRGGMRFCASAVEQVATQWIEATRFLEPL